ncbi:MAG: diguanylate cyclase [Alphaproteobacteria bacterium]|nr:diguanylate cyclase [Alphaproteobacteria bacterium]
MAYGHDVKKAEKFAESALQLMAGHGIPAEPNNFAVWYAYAAGENHDLCKAIDLVIASEDKVDTTHLEGIYEKFFGIEAESQALRDAADRIETAVTEVLGILGSAGKETSRYGQALEKYSDKLEKPLKLDQVRAIVTKIADETRRVIQRQKELDRALSRSSKEISELRTNLQTVRREASTDPLTGIANRKEFEVQIKAMVKEAEEEGEPLTLLLADIDFFKSFNDNYGHSTGDQVLKLVARTIIERIKGRDLAARLGGEEFAVLLPDTKLQDAVVVGNHIRVAVGSRKIVVRSTGENLGSVAISLGVAQYHPGEPIQSFIERTDRALYAAKRNGRDQVFADDSPPPSLAKSA